MTERAAMMKSTSLLQDCKPIMSSFTAWIPRLLFLLTERIVNLRFIEKDRDLTIYGLDDAKSGVPFSSLGETIHSA